MIVCDNKSCRGKRVRISRYRLTYKEDVRITFKNDISADFDFCADCEKVFRKAVLKLVEKWRG